LSPAGQTPCIWGAVPVAAVRTAAERGTW
jgi:hypothetical protein